MKDNDFAIKLAEGPIVIVGTKVKFGSQEFKVTGIDPTNEQFILDAGDGQAVPVSLNIFHAAKIINIGNDPNIRFRLKKQEEEEAADEI